MKFSTIILAASILLLDVEGKRNKPGNDNSGKEIDNTCSVISSTDVDGKKCSKTKGCAIVDNVCVDFELIACDEIPTNPDQKEYKKECKKNKCVFKDGICEVDRMGMIDNACTVDALDTLTEVDKNVCKKTVGCAIEDNECVNFELTPCDEIINPDKKKKCKKNGCVFTKDGVCEVDRKGMIDNACTVEPIDTLTEVDKNVCKKTVGCAIEDNECVNFELTPCDEIINPDKKKKCKKNGCVFTKDGVCEVDRKGMIDNTCTAIDTLIPIEVDKNVCKKTAGCVVEDKVCVDVTPCDEIIFFSTCKKNGCVFNKDAGTCEVNPLDLCIATCTDGDDISCCLKACQCSNYDKGGKCKKDSNCAVNKDTKVCALKSAGDTSDKCSKLNEEKCIGKKGMEKGCAYSEGSCSGCAVNNGKATDCENDAKGCAYDECTEHCSKKKE